MTEPTADLHAPPSPAHRRSGGRGIVLALGLVALVAMVIYLLSIPARHELARLALPRAQPAPVEDPRLAVLEGEIVRLRSRVDALEQRPAPVPAGAPPAAAAAAPVVPLAGTDPIVTALATRMDALGARQDRMDAQMIGQGAELKAEAARLEAAADQAAAVAALTDRTARLARVQAAVAALAAGQPLGALPGAPPALLRFQADPPPTEAALRLSFPAAARRARATARPETHGQGFWPALWSRAGSLVTIRRGDAVLVGSQQIGTIDQARTALDAGDLPGAVALVDRLTDGPADAMAAWRSQADALLQARAALAALARQA